MRSCKALGVVVFALAAQSVLAQPVPVPEITRHYGPLYGEKLVEYARAQGFDEPEEEKAVVAHELVHIAQAHNRGYYFDGVYQGPYLLDPVWQSFGLPTNKQVLAKMSHDQKNGFIPRNYAGNTPDNTLSNVIDEINAYRLTAPWICTRSYPERCRKQVIALSGHLDLAAQHLSLLRREQPEQAERFRASPAGKLAMRLILAGAATLEQIGGKPTSATKEFAIWKE